MDNLEKLFLLCMTLFGLLLIFLFGLYFDVGDVVAGLLHQTASGAASEEAEDQARAEAERRLSGNLPGYLPGRTTYRSIDDAFTDRYEFEVLGRCGVPPPRTPKELVQAKRAELAVLGFTNAEYVEMESLAEDREEFDRLMQEVRRLAADGRFPEAIRLLENAIQQANPRNLLVIRDYTGELSHMYSLARQWDKAKATTRKLYDLAEKILKIRDAGEREGPTRTGREDELREIKADKARMDQTFAEIEQRTKEAGAPTALTPAEKAQVKTALESARSSGQITEDEYQKALKEL